MARQEGAASASEREDNLIERLVAEAEHEEEVCRADVEAVFDLASQYGIEIAESESGLLIVRYEGSGDELMSFGSVAGLVGWFYGYDEGFQQAGEQQGTTQS